MPAHDFWWTVEHSVVIHGFTCTPAELTKRLRLKPTRACALGEPLCPHGRLATVSLWERSCREWKGDTAKINTEKHLRGLNRLVDEMHAHREAIASVVPPGEIYFKSIIQSDSPNISACLPLALNRRIIELDAEWVCSVWCNS